jgi:hypothetical protein
LSDFIALNIIIPHDSVQIFIYIPDVHNHDQQAFLNFSFNIPTQKY